jgi:NADH:ubiquinone oxidoreductase subunit K
MLQYAAIILMMLGLYGLLTQRHIIRSWIKCIHY